MYEKSVAKTLYAASPLSWPAASPLSWPATLSVVASDPSVLGFGTMTFTFTTPSADLVII